MKHYLYLSITLILAITISTAYGQKKKKGQTTTAYNETFYNALKWRNIEKLTETNNAVKNVRQARGQIKQVTSKLENGQHPEIKEKADTLLVNMKHIEEALYQTKNRSGQDPLNFPIRLNNKLGHLNSLMAMGDYQPTDQAIAFKEEITARIDKELEKLEKIFDGVFPSSIKW